MTEKNLKSYGLTFIFAAMIMLVACFLPLTVNANDSIENDSCSLMDAECMVPVEIENDNAVTEDMDVSEDLSESEAADEVVMIEEPYNPEDAGSFKLYVKDEQEKETLVDELFFDRFVSTKTIELNQNVTGVRVEKTSGYEVNLDQLTIDGKAPAGYERKLSVTDRDLIEVIDSIFFDICGNGMLTISARAPKALEGEEYSLRFPVENYRKDMNEESKYLTYSLNSKKESLTCEAPKGTAPFYYDIANCTTGHPIAPIKYYVANDEENLYVFTEVFGDNTLDHGKDHSGVYVLCGDEAKYFAVHTTDENAYGEWNFAYTDSDPEYDYQHMLYLVRIPLSEIKDAGEDIKLAFEYYGTMAAYYYATYEFKKVDENGNPLPDVSFIFNSELEAINEMEGISEENGVVSITVEFYEQPLVNVDKDFLTSDEVLDAVNADNSECYTKSTAYFDLTLGDVTYESMKFELYGYNPYKDDFVNIRDHLYVVLPNGRVATYDWYQESWRMATPAYDTGGMNLEDLKNALPSPAEIYAGASNRNKELHYYPEDGISYCLYESTEGDSSNVSYFSVDVNDGNYRSYIYNFEDEVWQTYDLGIFLDRQKVTVTETNPPEGYKNIGTVDPGFVRDTSGEDYYYGDGNLLFKGKDIVNKKDVPERPSSSHKPKPKPEQPKPEIDPGDGPEDSDTEPENPSDEPENTPDEPSDSEESDNQEEQTPDDSSKVPEKPDGDANINGDGNDYNIPENGNDGDVDNPGSEESVDNSGKADKADKADKPSKTTNAVVNKGASKTPKTGDESSVVFWIIAMIISMAGIILACRRREY